MPTQWTFYGADMNSDAGFLSIYGNDVEKYPKVRALLTGLKVRYAFVGKGKVTSSTQNDVGLSHLDTSPGFKLVYRNPDAAIYEIEGQQGVVTSGAASGSKAGDGQ
jgi:hypothetical protein